VARTTLGDPRLSLTERYGTHANYASAVAASASLLQAQRFLLPMDVATYIANAQLPITVTNNPIYGSYTW
jgi:Alpha/beta hydrolase domain